MSGKALFKGKSKLEDWTFNDLQKYMDFDKLKVNSKLIANKFNKNEKLSKFIQKPKPKSLLKKSNVGFSIDYFLSHWFYYQVIIR